MNERRTPWTMMNAVVHGDCVKGMSALPDDAIPLTVTSPPYDNLRTFGPWDFEKVAQELYRITKPGGVVCWEVQDGFEKGGRTLTSFRQALRFQDVGFRMWENLIVVLKSYQFAPRRRYLPHAQYCFILTKGRPNTVNLLRDKVNTNAGKVYRTCHRRNRDHSMRKGCLAQPIAPYGLRSNVWEYSTGFNSTTKDKEAFKHPALMPEALARDLILSFSRPYDVVLDPFAGAGTTAKMAMLEGRRWLGFEINNEYVSIARERLRKAERHLWASCEPY